MWVKWGIGKKEMLKRAKKTQVKEVLIPISDRKKEDSKKDTKGDYVEN